MLLRVEVFKKIEDAFVLDEIYEFPLGFTLTGNIDANTTRWLKKVSEDSEKGHKVFMSVKESSSL